MFRGFFTCAALLGMSACITAQEVVQPIEKPVVAEVKQEVTEEVKTGKLMKSEDFLEQCRKQLLGYSWVKLSGTINHVNKDGERTRPMTLKCAAQLIPNKITFKATINKEQSFKVEHLFGQKHDTKILENSLKAENGFDKIGIKPTDLSLAFMYWDYIKEYEPKSVGVLGTKCRVLLLANPDGKELVKVWLSEQYLGPLQVHWLAGIKENDERNPLQILKFEDFAEKNKVWVPLESKISNGKGELQIKFKEVDAAFSQTVPEDLYKTEE